MLYVGASTETGKVSGASSEKGGARGVSADLVPFRATSRAIDGWSTGPTLGLFNTLWPVLGQGVSFFTPIPSDSVTLQSEADVRSIAYSLAF
jgi:hypothetical protein